MSIDPDQVTIESLEKYENLMKGKVAKASSNANYQSGGNELCSIHTWRNDKRSHENEVGTFEMRFEKPTSLVSLNIDITFECSDSRKLLHGLKPELQEAIAEAKQEIGIEEIKEAIQITTTDAPEPKSKS